MTWRALRSITWTELKLFVREPVGLFFTVAFPLLLLLIIGWSFGGQDAGGGFRVVDLYIPSLYAMIIVNLALMSLPTILAEYRENGVFKRYQTTPVGLSAHVVAHILVQTAVFLVSAGGVTLLGLLVFHIHAAPGVWRLVPVLALGAVGFFAVGFLLGGILNSQRSTQAVGGALFFVMLFASGAAIPRVWFPHWLVTVTNYVPMARLVDPLVGVWQGESLTRHTTSLAVLAALGIAGIAAATRWFRWQATP